MYLVVWADCWVFSGFVVPKPDLPNRTQSVIVGWNTRKFQSNNSTALGGLIGGPHDMHGSKNCFWNSGGNVSYCKSWREKVGSQYQGPYLGNCLCRAELVGNFLRQSFVCISINTPLILSNQQISSNPFWKLEVTGLSFPCPLIRSFLSSSCCTFRLQFRFSPFSSPNIMNISLNTIHCSQISNIYWTTPLSPSARTNNLHLLTLLTASILQDHQTVPLLWWGRGRLDILLWLTNICSAPTDPDIRDHQMHDIYSLLGKKKSLARRGIAWHDIMCTL